MNAPTPPDVADRPGTGGRPDRSPGGVGDGLPSLPDGEPVLARWFVITMLLLSLVAIGFTVFALGQRVAQPDEAFPPAERRNPGTAEVTHDRGDVQVATDTSVSQPVSCAPEVRLVGDEGGRATLQRAFGVLCQQLSEDDDGSLAQVATGLQRLDDAAGSARIALGEATGVDSSARIEDGLPIIELAPKFQFDNARLAAPFLAHELFHLGSQTWPGAAVDAEHELAAMRVQAEVCAALRVVDEQDRPRGCGDAASLLEAPDPLQALRDAGYPAG